ncbi:MAG: cytochrome P450 [Myxococcota bacterium]|jgi:cytochrome P450
MLRDPVRFLVENHQQCGPVFRLRVLNRRFVVMAGVEANRFMLRHERDHLQSGPVFGGFGSELGGELFLASADGKTHQRLRRIQTNSYSASHLEKRVPEMVLGLGRRLGALQEGQRLDVQRLFQLILAEQVGLLLHNDGELAYILDDLIRVFRIALSVKVMQQWPPAILHWPAYRRSKARILAHAEKVAAQHRATPGEGRNDLVDDILAAVSRNDTIQEENVRLLTLGPLFGGIDTASNTSAFALYNVLARPEVRTRVMEEVRTVFADGPVPSWESFQKMTALRGAIMETLRMYPVAYLASRHVASSFTFGGHHIAAGEKLFVATAVPHFLPEYYPEPHHFDIDRYGPTRREHAKPGTFAPFGAGVHSCLGARFAQSQMLVTLATVLHRLDLEIDPPDYTLRVKSNPVTMPAGLVVRVGAVNAGSEPPDPWPAFSIDAKRRWFSR